MNIETINAWGKGTLFRYGMVETMINIIIIYVCAIFVNHLLKRWILRRYKENTKFILRMKTIFVYAIATYGASSLFLPFEKVSNALLASGGVVAVVLGLAAQDTVGNFVNGMMITVFKPFKIGDTIKLDDGQITGTVVDISLRHTVIRTYENTTIVVVNSAISKATLENISSLDGKKANFLFLDIDYDSDLELAMKIIEEEVLAHPSFIDGRSEAEKKKNVPKVITRLVSFEDSSMRLRTTIYSKDHASGFAMLSDLRISLKKRFDAEGISFPYPHRTITYKEGPNQS